MVKVLTIVTKEDSETNLRTLINNPTDNAKNDSKKNFFDFLKKEKIPLLEQKTLNPNRALDFFFTGLSSDEEKKLINFFDPKLVDVCLQENANRRKKALFSDMDGTVIENETFNDLGEILGLKKNISEITQLGIEGKIDFLTSLRKRVALLKGLEATNSLKKLEKKIRFSAGVFTLMKTLKKHQVKTFLITGGFNPISSHVAEKLGFDKVFANSYAIQENHFTGEMLDPIILPQQKREIVKRTIKDLGVTSQQAVSMGDGMNDLEMLGFTGLGVAYRGVKKLREKVPTQINVSDLTALLYFQGYKSDEIVYNK